MVRIKKTRLHAVKTYKKKSIYMLYVSLNDWR